jgi:hypothetical protein
MLWVQIPPGAPASEGENVEEGTIKAIRSHCLMTRPAEYILQLKTHPTLSPIVISFTVVEEKVWPDIGYIRIRMT